MSSENDKYRQTGEKSFSGFLIREYEEIRDDRGTVKNNKQLTKELLSILEDQERQ